MTQFPTLRGRVPLRVIFRVRKGTWKNLLACSQHARRIDSSKGVIEYDEMSYTALSGPSELKGETIIHSNQIVYGDQSRYRLRYAIRLGDVNSSVDPKALIQDKIDVFLVRSEYDNYYISNMAERNAVDEELLDSRSLIHTSNNMEHPMHCSHIVTINESNLGRRKEDGLYRFVYLNNPETEYQLASTVEAFWICLNGYEKLIGSIDDYLLPTAINAMQFYIGSRYMDNLREIEMRRHQAQNRYHFKA